MKTTVVLNIEIEHDEALDLEELQTQFIDPIKESISTAAVLGPNGVVGWKPTTTEYPLKARLEN